MYPSPAACAATPWDGAITRIGRLANPVQIEFEHGRAVEIRGGTEADQLRRLLASLDDPNAYDFAAWGMGTNPGADLTDPEPSFEGERVYRWAHLPPAATRRCQAVQSPPVSTLI